METKLNEIKNSKFVTYKENWYQVIQVVSTLKGDYVVLKTMSGKKQFRLLQEKEIEKIMTNETE